jgi:hypothetical protein
MGMTGSQGSMGMHGNSSPHIVRPSVVPTKHAIAPVKVSSHHVDNSSDVLYDIEITVDEYFPDKKLASALMFVDWVAQSVEVGSVISWHVA